MATHPCPLAFAVNFHTWGITSRSVDGGQRAGLTVDRPQAAKISVKSPCTLLSEALEVV